MTRLHDTCLQLKSSLTTTLHAGILTSYSQRRRSVLGSPPSVSGSSSMGRGGGSCPCGGHSSVTWKSSTVLVTLHWSTTGITQPDSFPIQLDTREI